MTIISILKKYDFMPRGKRSLWWGIGSTVWGHIAEVTPMGGDVYSVRYHEWQYNCDGDCVVDEDNTIVLYGAQVLTFLFENLPLF